MSFEAAVFMTMLLLIVSVGFVAFFYFWQQSDARETEALKMASSLLDDLRAIEASAFQWHNSTHSVAYLHGGIPILLSYQEPGDTRVTLAFRVVVEGFIPDLPPVESYYWAIIPAPPNAEPGKAVDPNAHVSTGYLQ